MSAPRPELELFERLAKALANESRLRILTLLADGELCVCQITGALGQAPATVSKHLAVLRGCGLIDSRPDGRWVYYRLADPAPGSLTEQMLDLIRDTLSNTPEAVADRRRAREADIDRLETAFDQGLSCTAPSTKQEIPVS